MAAYHQSWLWIWKKHSSILQCKYKFLPYIIDHERYLFHVSSLQCDTAFVSLHTIVTRHEVIICRIIRKVLLVNKNTAIYLRMGNSFNYPYVTMEPHTPRLMTDSRFVFQEENNVNSHFCIQLISMGISSQVIEMSDYLTNRSGCERLHFSVALISKKSMKLQKFITNRQSILCTNEIEHWIWHWIIA